MISTTWLLLIIALMVSMVLSVPAKVELRIRILHSMGPPRIAGFHRPGFRPIVWTVKVVLVALAAHPGFQVLT